MRTKMENSKDNNLIQLEQFEKLAKEVDYQKTYSYEKRVDIFNKYGISTSINYVNPIMLLASYLCERGGWEGAYSTRRFYGVSHSGAVLSNFNKEFEKGKSPYLEFSKNGSHFRYNVFYGSTRDSFKRRVTFYVWDDSKNDFKFRLWETQFLISSNTSHFDYFKEAKDFIKMFLY